MNFLCKNKKSGDLYEGGSKSDLPSDDVFKTVKPRKMENDDWVIPFSMAIVIKKLENFNHANCYMDATMTLIMRIRLTGLPK